jgi:hypothetical protein
MGLKNKFFFAVLVITLAAALATVMPPAALCSQTALSDGETN